MSKDTELSQSLEIQFFYWKLGFEITKPPKQKKKGTWITGQQFEKTGEPWGQKESRASIFKENGCIFVGFCFALFWLWEYWGSKQAN